MTTYERSWWWWVKEKKQMVLVFIIVTMMVQHQTKGCVETERVGLLQLKSYLNSLLIPNASESILESWSDDNRSSDCCHWERVECSDGHVSDLSLDWLMPLFIREYDKPRVLNLSLLHSFPRLQSFVFSGNYFDDLFDPIHGYKSFPRLKKLKTLDLSYNSLNNSVLPFLSSARSLRNLTLKWNNFKGVFPPNGLMNLTELEELNLSLNRINLYDFEAVDAFKRLKKLRTLDLSVNEHNNSVLPFLNAARSLRTLILWGNNLEGVSNLNVLKDMPKLQQLDLSYNRMNRFTDLDSLGALLPSSLQVLSLRFNRLSSTPKGYSEICRLRDLRELGLGYNALTSMPNCLGNLSRLRTLDLSYNHLNGDLSSFVSGLPSVLEYLSLHGNNFNGSFSFSSLVNYTSLTVFELSSEAGIIQAQAESSWVPLFQLKILELNSFSLGSTIPGFLIHQHDLSFVDLSFNNLTIAFPTWLVQNNTRLHTILLNSNSLTKLQLPRLVHGLEVLDVSSNMIEDSVQQDIGTVFPNLRYMNFSSNHFYGAIPSSMGEMKRLEFLDMSSNGLYGQLPEAFLSGCYSLKFLSLSNNQVGGRVLPEHANLTSLRMLLLGGNSFNGSLGKGLLNSTHLQLIDVSDNCISGNLPLWIGRMSSLWFLYVRGNQLKGPFPRQLQNLALKVLDISHNSFSGSIPENFDFSSLGELRLQSNEFVGSIPDTLFNAKQLEILDLRNNNFSGMILNTVSENSVLRVLLLRNNSLQGPFPEKICQLTRVGLLDLSYNKLKGVIPSCLDNMLFSGGERPRDMWIIDTHIDIMEFLFKHYWSYTSALHDEGARLKPQRQPTSAVNFLTKSRYEAYEGDIIGNLYGLDLSSNQLSGEIPVEIGNLHNIKSLNLSSNHLVGSIPDSISKLKDLESLDLSYNKLDGSIPPQLADLSSLGYFNVSFNNLSGEIPTNGHLLTFGETSYIGNARLCGLPTKISCNSARAPEQAKEEEEEESDSVIDMVWFYWTCGAVYISTSLALFAFLFIDSRWSQEWFYRVDLFIHHLQRFKDRYICN